ncbi:hypothetical protein [Amycolatopsis sp. cmx-8-4]|uniref:hypothetical protein n=1 Tax=Amycolatopsis sp. cmx-8-4 TaxID=2790947 RepID=UPI00397D0421
MGERQTTSSRRKRRSSATLERLEAARRRRTEQLERERENEARVDAALVPFAEAVTAIEAVERRREDRVAALESQLDRKLAELNRQRSEKVAEFERQAEQVRVDAEMEIGEWRAVMATSVAQIRAADVGAAETAALLGISAKAVTALSRSAAAMAVSESGDRQGQADEVAENIDDESNAADAAEFEVPEGESVRTPDVDGAMDTPVD